MNSIFGCRSIFVPLLVGLFAQVGSCAIVLDQEYDSVEGGTAVINVQNGLKIEHAQTFTAGLNGELVRIELKLWRTSEQVVAPLMMDIRTVVAGVPSEDNVGANILWSVELAASSVPVSPGLPIPGFMGFDLGVPVSVVAGEQYAIVLRSSQPSNVADNLQYLALSNPDPTATNYVGGGNYVRANSPWFTLDTYDINFRTYVSVAVPEPSGCATLAVIGSLAASRYYRRLQRLPVS